MKTTSDGFTALDDKPCDSFRQARESAEDVCACGYYKSDHRPAPIAGEREEWACSHSGKQWDVHRNATDVVCEHDYIAIATTRKHAAQIVRDHAHAALVPDLVDALSDCLERLRAYRSLSLSFPLTEKKAEAALNAARKAGV